MRVTRFHVTTVAAALLATALGAPPAARARTGYATEERASEGRSDRYREGQRALAEERWADASKVFSALADAAGPETDAALYWQAYAEAQRQHKKEALEAIRRLLAGFPASPWADDARALQLEIQGRGEVSPAIAGDDEELRLYALDALLQVEPERAVPVLERILAGDRSTRVKSRALFVLSQSDSPRARQILERVVRTGEPLELRIEAVRTLGIAGDPEDLAVLASIAGDRSAPAAVREAVLEAYLIAGAGDRLAEIARRDPEPAIRNKAIQLLGALGSTDELHELWASEKDPGVQRRLIEALAVAGDVPTLARAAREAATSELRHKAIEGLAITGADEAAPILRTLYRELHDPGDRDKVLQAFMILGDGKSLIELFRAEKDPELRKKIVRMLAMVDDPAATELLLEIVEKK